MLRKNIFNRYLTRNAYKYHGSFVQRFFGCSQYITKLNVHDSNCSEFQFVTVKDSKDLMHMPHKTWEEPQKINAGKYQYMTNSFQSCTINSIHRWVIQLDR